MMTLDGMEPACPVCFEPYITEAPEDEDEEYDTRPVLLPCGSTKCLFCCHAERGAKHTASSARVNVSAGALPTTPFELNHALIYSIIKQQHRRVACIPTELDQQETDAFLRALATSLVAAGNTPCSATLSVAEPSECAWIEPLSSNSTADCLSDAPSDAVEPGSPLYFPCTQLRAQHNSSMYPAEYDHTFAGASAFPFVQDLAVHEAGVQNAPMRARGTTPEQPHTQRQEGLSLEKMSPFLHPCAAKHSNGFIEGFASAAAGDSVSCAKPHMVTTCSATTNKLPIANALSITPMSGASEVGFEVTERPTALLVLSAPASAHACAPCMREAADDDHTTEAGPLLYLRQCSKGSNRSSVTSASMLSMHTAAHFDPSASPSDSASGAASPLLSPLPMHTVHGGELEIPEGVTVGIEGSFVFSKVHFRGLGSTPACITVQGTSVSFVDCTFEACGLLVATGGSATVERCGFLRSSAAVCAAGTGTRVTLTSCSFALCSEALSISTGARVHAFDCVIRDCRVNSMHVAAHGQLSMHACSVLRGAGFGIWAADTSVANLSDTAMHACQFGPVHIAPGARVETADV